MPRWLLEALSIQRIFPHHPSAPLLSGTPDQQQPTLQLPHLIAPIHLWTEPKLFTIRWAQGMSTIWTISLPPPLPSECHRCELRRMCLDQPLERIFFWIAMINNKHISYNKFLSGRWHETYMCLWTFSTSVLNVPCPFYKGFLLAYLTISLGGSDCA